MPLSAADLATIRAAEQALAGSFDEQDPAAWVPYYTEDAIFCGPGVTFRGRAELLAVASAIVISSMQIETESTIGDGDFAATFGRGTWVSGTGPDAAVVKRRFLMVWRKDADGQWRIAREQLTEDQ
jgi:ketosteroid isomerase-like protein